MFEYKQRMSMSLKKNKNGTWWSILYIKAQDSQGQNSFTKDLIKKFSNQLN